MKATERLYNLGQSLWIDNVSRDMLNAGTLEDYIEQFSVRGLTSNPTIFEQAVGSSPAYVQSIQECARKGLGEEDLFFDLAIEDLRRAADLFRSIHEESNGVDGWVSLELSPLLAEDTKGSIRAAKDLFARAERPNLFVKIPGTPEGVPAIEEAIFAGVPINVTLLFSREQYLAAAEAYLRGVERRIEAGLNPSVGSVASVFVSRWDVAVASKVPEHLRNRLGIVMAQTTYSAYLSLLRSPRWLRAFNAGARPQRLLWASTGTKDPQAPKLLYVTALATPFTINTLPESTLKALSSHSAPFQSAFKDEASSAELLEEFKKAGVDLQALPSILQTQGAESFSKSWKGLMEVVRAKRNTMVTA